MPRSESFFFRSSFWCKLRYVELRCRDRQPLACLDDVEEGRLIVGVVAKAEKGREASEEGLELTPRLRRKRSCNLDL